MELIFYIFVYKYLDDRSGVYNIFHYKPVSNHSCRGGGKVGGAMSFWTVLHSCHPVTINSSNSQWWVLKVLFSEMDQAEIRLIRQIFINGSFIEVF